MRQAPNWFRHLLYNLHLRRLDRFCQYVGRHICIYPAGHLTKKDAEVIFNHLRDLDSQ